MNPPRVLITGCGGMLGNAVYPYFVQRCPFVVATDKVVSETWLKPLDVRDRDALSAAFETIQPDLVLHLAAETDLEFCETHPNIAENTNATGTRYIAELAEAYDATLVYISTAGVFDGEKEGFYTEDDTPNPIMVYGQTKYDGEKHVRALCRKHYVIRAGWMVGGGVAKDKKFVHKILEQVLARKTVIHAVSDRWGTPTYTHDFALNLFRLLDSRQYGTYHMVCEGRGTRYDVAQELIRICGRHHDIRLVSVDSDFFSEEYFAPRPRSEAMTNANLRRLGINLMRPWQVALYEYVNREFPHAIATPHAHAHWDGLERRALRNRRTHIVARHVAERRDTRNRRFSNLAAAFAP